MPVLLPVLLLASGLAGAQTISIAQTVLFSAGLPAHCTGVRLATNAQSKHFGADRVTQFYAAPVCLQKLKIISAIIVKY